ncbi:MAG TPA: PKD domain-containing protein [Thermoplasmata archaeon]|nr:PKD domain-containing protein [Thermoplasmata archaeon]
MLPSLRYGQAVAYDSGDGYLVLFGGLAAPPSGGYLNDTWIYQNGSWTNVSASVGPAPPARAYASLVSDARDGYLVLVGGTCVKGNFCNDTWEFSGGQWHAGGAAPINPGSSDTVAVYDSTDGYLLMADCATHAAHRFSAGVWSSVPGTTPRGCSPAMSDDPANHGVLFDGGEQGGYYGGTWLYSSGNWTNVTATSGPMDNLSFALSESIAAYDPQLGAVLQLSPAGYRIGSSGLGTTFTYTYNSTWTNITGPVAPPWDSYPGLAWDPSAGGVVLVDLEASPSLWIFTAHPAIVDAAAKATLAVADVGIVDTFAATFYGGTGPFGYSWSFGDGTTGTGASPAHAYSALGTYTVTVQITDSAGDSATASTTVQVVQDLVAAPSALPNPTEVGLSTQFSAGLSGGVAPEQYGWAFGDGSTSATAGPSHTYSKAGKFVVNLSASDSVGSRANASFGLVVDPALSVSLSVNPAAPDLGQLTNFTANVTGGVGAYRYSWVFGDGGTGGNLSRIAHVYTTDGPFTAAVTVRDGAGAITSATATLNIALNLSIVGSWSMGAAPLPVSFGSHVQGGRPGYAYYWEFGDGATSSLPSPAHTYAQAGFYQATLTVTDAAGTTAQAIWPLYIAAGGEPLGVAVVAAPSQVAVGGVFVVSAQPAGGVGGYALHWSTGAAVCAATGIASERCTEGSAGQYTLSVVVTDGAGQQAQGSSVVAAGGPITSGIHPTPANGLPSLTVALLGVAAGAAVALGGVAIAQRIRLRRSAPEEKGPPASPPENGGPDSGEGADPFEDLI